MLRVLILIAAALCVVGFLANPMDNKPLALLAVALGLVAAIPSGRTGAKVSMVLVGVCFVAGIVIPLGWLLFWPIAFLFALRVLYYVIFQRAREEATV